jgi:FkbM family methyltransferase
MPRDKWVTSTGLDTDGTLFVDTENGIILYDTCLKTPLPKKVSLQAADLMKMENRPLYYRFHAALNEISEVMVNALYDRDFAFKKGDVVVDAGSRIGTFTAKISACVGEKGRIVAIEPEPENYACLVKNIRANRLDNVIPVRKILWSNPGRMPLYLSGNSFSHSTYCDAFFGSTGESIEVEADSLDNILEEAGIDRVDFIKMDIEGSEVEALKGMKKTLESDPAMAIAAYHPINGQPTYKAVIAELQRLGFKTSYSDEIVHALRNPYHGPGKL